MIILLITLAIAAGTLKLINTKARFEEADREREAREAEAAELEEIRNSAVDVEEEAEAETVDFEVEE